MNVVPLLRIENLRVEFPSEKELVVGVDSLSFDIAKGETLAVVGESGSGKSVTALAVTRLVEFGGGRIAGGALHFERRNGKTVDLARMPPRIMRSIRGSEIAMIFQEPMTSLNPVYTVGDQIAEALRIHMGMDRQSALAQALDIIDRVRIPDAKRRLRQYPHELSGGMRQRVMIAMALACEPRLLIADEPTTALDVTIQAQILELIRQLREETGMSVLFITHDMGVVAEVADRVVVMRGGRKVEENQVASLFATPTASYTRALLDAVPKLGEMAGKSRPEFFPLAENGANVRQSMMPDRAETGDSLLQVEGLVTRFGVRKGLLRRTVANIHAVEDVSFTVKAGETLALVGESGCGKSTTGRSVLRLVEPVSGAVLLNGQDVLKYGAGELQKARRDMQMIFQDPFASLNPRRTAFDQVAEPLVIHRVASGSELEDRVVSLIERVGLSADQLRRYPHEFSGGQRQRLCIARALSLSPKLIVADEAVSALDVSIQAQVINLLLELQQQLGLSYLFISHDMAVVERLSHQVAVMNLGRIVEIGPRQAVFDDPRHDYTKTLLASVPHADPTRKRERFSLKERAIPSPMHPVGYQLHAMAYDEVTPGHRVAVG